MKHDDRCSILLIDSNLVYRKSLTFIFQSEFNFQVVERDNFFDLQNMPQEKKDQFTLIVFEVEQSISETQKVNSLLRENFLNANIIGISNDLIESDITDDVYKRSEYLKEAQEFVKEFYEIDQTVEPKEFTEIKFDTLSIFESISFDMFIQLKSLRYIKLYKSGDKITNDDVKKYQKKGVVCLYIKKPTYLWILKVINEHSEEISQGNAIDANYELQEEIEQESASIEEVENEGLTPNIEEGPFKMEKTIVQKVHAKMDKTLKHMKKNRDIAKLLKKMNVSRDEDRYYQNRIKLCLNISSSLAKVLGWDSDASLEKLIYVIYLHDICLMKRTDLAKIFYKVELEVLDLDLAEKELVLNHASIAANLAKNDHHAPPEADIIIAQHHELPDGNGFPDGINGTRVKPYAAILCITIHFAQYILDNPNWDLKNYVAANKNKFRGGTFTKVFNALTKLQLK